MTGRWASCAPSRHGSWRCWSKYADGPPSIDYRSGPDETTQRAVRLLAALLTVPPGVVRCHARCCRWPAGRKLRLAVDFRTEEFCPARLAERAAKQARAEAADARRRAARASHGGE
ncbi:hypothetical protein [Streptomyces sp. NRRL S-350]|uniref:hypothetical protein n=1 Tax=Streptomyces sp. NRRL S-350 TaxID=1463902 RepID=UPI0004C04766|nr:hypothetical protein [Streptomyces sp. NRRL S-350]